MDLQVQAYKKEIILPNKHKGGEEAFYEGHLLDTETYVGGHVESIEAGVFRADIPTTFAVDTTAIDEVFTLSLYPQLPPELTLDSFCKIQMLLWSLALWQNLRKHWKMSLTMMRQALSLRNYILNLLKYFPGQETNKGKAIKVEGKPKPA